MAFQSLPESIYLIHLGFALNPVESRGISLSNLESTKLRIMLSIIVLKHMLLGFFPLQVYYHGCIPKKFESPISKNTQNLMTII